MYIIELIIKILKNRNIKRQTRNEDEQPENCSHIFLPIDSTKEILACSKCGIVIKAKDLKAKPKNPFN